MAPSKKRNSSSQSTTLLKFFVSESSTACGPATKRVKREPVSFKIAPRGLTAEDPIVIEDVPDVSRTILAAKLEDVAPTFVNNGHKSFALQDPLLRKNQLSLRREQVPTLLSQSVKNETESNSSTEYLFNRSDSPWTSIQGQDLGGDEWALGDDEIIEDEGDIEDTDDLLLDELKSSSKSCEMVCPICSLSILGMANASIDEHVNACIDSLSKSKPNSVSKNSRVMQPLHTFPQPTPPKHPTSSLKAPNLFSVLMSSCKENEAWKEATVVEDKTFRPTKANGGRRKAPFYKVMPGMPIAVDAFRYGNIPGVTAYLLSHAHSDHYTNLSSSWKSGPIYCSTTTANLVIHMLGVGRRWVHPLPNDTPIELPNTGGVKVTLIEANHCPGSSLFLFEGHQTVNAGDSTFASPFVGSKRIFRYLHCGDFRASPQHVLHPAIKGKRIDQVYLDTTYLNPKYCFPPQPLVIDACAELAKRIVYGDYKASEGPDDGAKSKSINEWVSHQKVSGKSDQSFASSGKSEKVLVVIGTYSIGKERIVKAIAKALQSKIYCDPRKTALLRCQNDPELHSLLSDDPYGCTVHVVPLQVINSDRFSDYVDRWGHFTKAVGFRPTGWTYTPPVGTDTLPAVPHVIARDQNRTFTYASLKPMRNSTPNLMLYGVPYSEHSSFFELSCFALSFDWGKMVATVNVGSASSRDKMAKWFERWDAERKKMSVARTEEGVVCFRRSDYW